MKIISGGQTGADQGALLGAVMLGISTGGTAPKGFKTENGPEPILASLGLVESFSDDYLVRTEENILNADATVIVADQLNSPGTRRTISLLKRHDKPFIINPTPEQLREFARDFEVINFAGNRESKAPGIENRTKVLVISAFGSKG